MNIKILIAGGLLAVVTTAPAQLLITEINSNASEGDFWELTNLGSTSVNLFTGSTPWSWNDDHYTNNPIAIPLGTTIAAGESVVFLAGGATDTASFIAAWGLGSSVQVFGDANSQGLGKNDAIYLFDASGAVVTSLLYSKNDFTLSDGSLSLGGHAGAAAGGSDNDSLIWDPTSGSDSPRYTFANGSNFGSFNAVTGDGVGSPGFAVASVPEPSTLAIAGLGLAACWQFRRRRN
jgi:predicted extracellular nuclease